MSSLTFSDLDMNSKYIETEIIEHLNEATTLRGYFISAVEILNAAIDTLIQKVFRKDDYAVKYAVNPLLEASGPLSDLSVRLKLIFGLGLISQSLYQDIENIVNIRNFLNNSGEDFTFTSPEILSAINKINVVQKTSQMQLNFPDIDTEMDSLLKEMRERRQKQIVESTLSLAISEICIQIGKESSLTG